MAKNANSTLVNKTVRTYDDQDRFGEIMKQIHAVLVVLVGLASFTGPAVAGQTWVDGYIRSDGTYVPGSVEEQTLPPGRITDRVVHA